MPIQVTCPNCLKRFQVSDKFAGKSGPCPNCKKTIKVPDKSEEVVVHAPEDQGPKDRSGQSVLKPLTRTETDVTRKGLLLTIGAVLLVFGVAIAFRFVGEAGPPLWAQIVGLFALAPPLVWAAYTFVYDQEREPYLGSELRNRVLICSVIYAALWLIYAFLPSYVLELSTANEMSYATLGVAFCIMLAIGTFVAVATFELEAGGGFLHASLYFVAIVLLAFVSGVTLAGQYIEPALR